MLTCSNNLVQNETAYSTVNDQLRLLPAAHRSVARVVLFSVVSIHVFGRPVILYLNLPLSIVDR